ncbi:23S rRNA (guanosine2251-2'-O)-methyltransferase [Faunimonas pinastri]|uniref:23S rRNA (Guanosine2251-2'-O)-methyltransferase n=1 Tax=Faunimonas pinastri TaxID=1855383 RepID=A0A1H9KRG7_9HYPH|nr:23S rRNA (guanosine(2251)-2'-O)-methyltransferase RlmB [Faunimonas pinastri]SER01688.1 23S rRNA (guanosine2251-2'-O)-methyltransferase [Faunimonas pinastri]
MKAKARRPQSTRPAKQHAEGRSVIYGWHSALAALRNPARRILSVLATANAAQRLAEEIPDFRAPEPVEAREIDRLVGGDAVHQGIAVVVEPLEEKDLDELAEGKLVVVLDQITDPHNVGAILRSASAFGADALIMTERHGPADSAVMAKAASGGLEHVAIVRVKNLARTMDELGELGFLRLGLDSEHADPIESVAIDGPVALVLGAEGKGLRRLTREKCDRLVRLDMPGAIKSLNVSNAAALALYAVNRQRK